MAYAKVIQTYTDGSSNVVQMGIKADGPDALDELVKRAAVLWKITVGTDDDEPEIETGP